MMRAKRTDDGIYVVVKHETNHNHTMTREEWSHFHRSERQITDEKARAIEDMTSSGMRATESFRYLAHNVGGEENVGHTMKDHINFVNRLKSNIIEAGDAETVLDMLQDQEAEENDFFYKIKMDDEGRLANIFWRDSMMKEDYEIYGDVMNTIKRWRRVEQQDEFNCSRARPDSYFEIAGMVSHASEHDTTTVYTVTSSKEECCGQVIFDSGLNLITCSCMKFEVDGMLCHHSLRILLINSVQRIPEACIKKRWTKIAKSEVWDKFGKEKSNTEKLGNSIPWRHEMTRKLYNLVLR
ncbi:hypothetical protein ACS0TY_034462 [Phlomoides rotata]